MATLDTDVVRLKCEKGNGVFRHRFFADQPGLKRRFFSTRIRPTDGKMFDNFFVPISRD